MRNQALNVTQLHNQPKITNLVHIDLQDEELQNSKTLKIDIPSRRYEHGYLSPKSGTALFKQKPTSNESKELLLSNNSKTSSFKLSKIVSMIYFFRRAIFHRNQK